MSLLLRSLIYAILSTLIISASFAQEKSNNSIKTNKANTPIIPPGYDYKPFTQARCSPKKYRSHRNLRKSPAISKRANENVEKPVNLTPPMNSNLNVADTVPNAKPESIPENNPEDKGKTTNKEESLAKEKLHEIEVSLKDAKVTFRNFPTWFTLAMLGLVIGAGILFFKFADDLSDAGAGALLVIIGVSVATIIFVIGGWWYQPSKEQVEKLDRIVKKVEETKDILPALTNTSAATLPTSPSNLIAILASNTQISLSWIDRSSNENAFELERKTGSEGQYILLSNLGQNTTSYADTGIHTGQIYSYRIKAVNSVGASLYSNEVSVTMPGPISLPTEHSAVSNGTTVTGRSSENLSPQADLWQWFVYFVLPGFLLLLILEIIIYRYLRIRDFRKDRDLEMLRYMGEKKG